MFNDAIEKFNFCSLSHDHIDRVAELHIERLHLKRFSKKIMFSNTVPVRKIADAMRAQKSAILKPLKRTMIASFFDSKYEEIGTRQDLSVLTSPFAFATRAKKDPFVRAFFTPFPARDETLFFLSTRASLRRLSSSLHDEPLFSR